MILEPVTILGLAAISTTALLLWAAFHAERRGKVLPVALAIVAAGLVLRTYVSSDRFLHPWDERYHALVAKNLTAHPLRPMLYDQPLLPYDYRDWRGNHIWLHKPPLMLWLMAGSMKLFGTNELAMRLPSLLLSTAAIFLTFAIGAQLWAPRVGLLAAFFHAINGYLLQLPAGRVPADHIDNGLVFLVELGVLLAVIYARTGDRALLLAIGASAGLAVMTKSLPGLVVFPVWLALVWPWKRPADIARDIRLMALVCALFVLPWYFYTYRAFPQETEWETAYLARHVYERIEGLGGSVFFYLLGMPRYFGEIVYLPLGWFVMLLASNGWRRTSADTSRAAIPSLHLLTPVAVWLLVPYVVFSLLATKMDAYIMTAAPAVFLIEALFWLWLIEQRRLPASWPGRALYWAVLALLIVLPTRYTFERLKTSPHYDRNPIWARELRELPARVGLGQAVLFNVDRPIEAMFYTPYPAYEGLPTTAEIAQLRRDGFRVIVLDHGDLPPSLRRSSVLANTELVGVSPWPNAPRPSAGIRSQAP